MRAAALASGVLRVAAAAGVLLLSAAAQAAAPASADAMVKIEPATRTVIKGGLKYLADQQRLNGSWAIKDGREGHPVAITSYVLLAYMATGNLPGEGDYSKNVTAGQQFLLDRIQPDGLFQDVSSGQYMYNHGMATIALAEMYGQSTAASLKPRLEKLVNVILKAQAPDGGWRYTPQPHDSDVSVTVMQAVALRAAQESGLSVPQEAIDKAIAYVSSCCNAASGGFAYQPGKEPGYARTAAAIYSLQVLGHYKDPAVEAGSRYLFSKVKARDQFWVYGSYYAAPAQYMIGGETWRNWYEGARTTIMAEVHRQGELAWWEPKNPQQDVSPLFCTAVFVHILAMPLHYLPLYQR